MTKSTTENKLAVYSSYVAFYQNAKQKKTHAFGENLLMLVMKKIKTMIGEKESINWMQFYYQTARWKDAK